jgi:hypothetical protein
MVRLRKVTIVITYLAVLGMLLPVVAPARQNGTRERITANELKDWLTYLASDEFEGRATFTEGLGLAAAHIAGQLKLWGVKPGGPNGSYFQRVAVLGVKTTNRSTVTVEANGQTRTFKDGEGISLPRNVGGKRQFTADQIEFLGYGLNAPGAGHDDFAGKDVKGKVVVFLGGLPKALNQPQNRRLLGGRARYATDVRGAIATIGAGGGGGGQGGGPPQGGQQPGGQQAAQGAQPGGQGQGGFGGLQPERPDFTTVQRLDSPIPPAVNARDEFFESLLGGQLANYADLKSKAAAGDPLPTFMLKNVKLTFNIDADYQIVNTQYTRNVVGVIEGTDPRLKETYVAFGAHYDHVGYAQGEVVQTQNGPRRAGAPGRVKEGVLEDRIWNGADDDGSGTVTLLAVAKAFAHGPKPRRSLMFTWFAGEERGLWGSRYYVDYPTVPIDRIVAQLNMDMVGRNRDDKAEEGNSVYLVGSDRISTELHNITIDANTALKTPLKLDFEFNDPSDPEQIYYRSDHYSYAAKGIPVVFFTTGLHSDYHFNTDSPEKINYEKMARIGQLVHEIGMRVGNLDHAPARDHRGPRVGKGSSGKLNK